MTRSEIFLQFLQEGVIEFLENVEFHIATDLELVNLEINFEQCQIILNAILQIFKLFFLHHILEYLIENVVGVHLHLPHHNKQILLYPTYQCHHQLHNL